MAMTCTGRHAMGEIVTDGPLRPSDMNEVNYVAIATCMACHRSLAVTLSVRPLIRLESKLSEAHFDQTMFEHARARLKLAIEHL
jgi:hypothetical protein